MSAQHGRLVRLGSWASRAGSLDPEYPLLRRGLHVGIALLLVLGTAGAGLVAYVGAYQAIGLTEKVAVGSLVGALGSVGGGILAGHDAADIALATILVIGGKLVAADNGAAASDNGTVVSFPKSVH